LDKKKISAIVRRLASDNQGEVIACVTALRKMCNLNDLGDLIEKGTVEVTGNSLSKEEMQYIYNQGFKDGVHKGLNDAVKGKGVNSTANSNSNGSSESPPWEDVSGSKQEEMVRYCEKHKLKLGQKERGFVESIYQRYTAQQKPLTPPQLKWLKDIYLRLGGK
jgi:cell shape-determining protein MreC